MAKIRNSNPKNSSGGYERLLGNKELADIFTKAQSTVISNGTELENIITSRANNIEDLNDFMNKVNSGQMENGVFLCTKKVTKKSYYKLEGHEPDFLIFSIKPEGKVAYVIELKDGDTFDTKKSAGEKLSLKQFKMHLGSMIEFRTNYKICAFNQLDKEKIVTGFKNEFTIDEVWTGKDFCDILNINYEEIIKQRMDDTLDNYIFVVETLAEIKDIQKKVLEKVCVIADEGMINYIDNSD